MTPQNVAEHHRTVLELFENLSAPEAEPYLSVDLDVLISSRMLVQANSGGGKSWFLRYLLEQTHGHVQQIVLDPEGEYATLREKFDYLLAGEGGDVPARPSMAREFCRRVMELGVSTVIDLYEMQQEDRQVYVAEFLDELVNLPAALWKPLLVVVDEAQLLAPEGTTVVSSFPMRDMASRGRKRGFCLVCATQRLSKLDKTVAAELANKAIGRTGLDVDLKRAADELGFDNRMKASLKHLAPGDFYVYGPALSQEVIRVRSGSIRTTHPQPGKIAPAPPPAPEAIRTMVEHLQDLAQRDKEAEEAALAQAVKDLNRIQELESEIARLDEELLRVGGAEAAATAAATEEMQRELEILRARDRDAEFIIGEMQRRYVVHTEALEAVLDSMRLRAEQYRCAAGAETQRVGVYDVVGGMAASECRFQNADSGTRPASPACDPHPGSGQNLRTPSSLVGRGLEQAPVVQKPSPRPAANPQAGLTEPMQRVLDALGTYAGFGQKTVERAAVAALAGYRQGGHFNNICSELARNAYIHYPDKGHLALTGKGEDHAAARRFASVKDVHAAWFELCDGPQSRVLREVLEVYPETIHRQVISDRVSMKGGHFNNTVSALKTLGAIEYPSPGWVKASRLLFPEGLISPQRR